MIHHSIKTAALACALAVVLAPAQADARCRDAKPNKTYVGVLGNANFGQWRCQLTFNRPKRINGVRTMTLKWPSSCYGPTRLYQPIDGSIALKGCRLVYHPLRSVWGAMNDHLSEGKFKGKKLVIKTKSMKLRGTLKRR